MKRISILIAASTAFDGGMNIHLRSISDALSTFAQVSSVDDRQNITQTAIDRHDYVVRYGWSTLGEGSFARADFSRHISSNPERNIFCCCFDSSLLSDPCVASIKSAFRTIWYDSSFSMEKGASLFDGLHSAIVNPSLLDWKSLNGVSSDRFRLLHVSNSLYRIKGVDLIERAFREAFAPHEKVILRLVVKDKDQSLLYLLDAFKKRGHQLEVVPKHVPHGDVWNLYADADCYVCASRSETFGLPALEAAASGLPVIAHRHGGMRDYLNMIAAHEVTGKLEEMPPNEWRHNRQSTWFEPCIKDLSAKMRSAFERRERFPDQIEALRESFSPKAIGQKLHYLVYA